MSINVGTPIEGANFSLDALCHQDHRMAAAGRDI